jgi:hypothetical protein
VEKVDKRIPYIYRIPDNNPLVRNHKLIKEYRTKLINKDSSNTIVNMLMKAPTNEWVDIANDLESAAIAIRQLDTEGLLLETLEG